MNHYQQKHLQRLQADSNHEITTLRKKIKTNIQELKIINEDMKSTDFDQVMEKVSENDFKVCCDFYREKYNDFSHEYLQLTGKIDHCRTSKTSSCHLSVVDIQNTIDKVEKILNEFYNPHGQTRSRTGTVQNFLKQYERASKSKGRAKEYQSYNPLGERGEEITSPQFKNI